MDQTSNLKLPYIVAAQAQKHVTHNEAIRTLDALLHLAVESDILAEPPVDPKDGQRWIVASPAQGAWQGHESDIAARQDEAWVFLTPQEGWVAWNSASSGLLVRSNGEWVTFTSGSAGTSSDLFGINTQADTINRLAVKSDAVLLSHDESASGTGNTRLVSNKQGSNKIASHIYQSDYIAKAEAGLIATDDFRVRVSPQSGLWKDAIFIDGQTGSVVLPATPQARSLLMNGDFLINQRTFAGGNLPAGTFGHDRWKAGAGGVDYTVAGDGTVTLTSGSLIQNFESRQVAGDTISISVDLLGGGDLTVSLGASSAVISGGTGRRSATLAAPSGGAAVIDIELTPVNDPVVFARVKAEPGSVATAWQFPDPDAEFLKVSRYFYRRLIEGYSEICSARSHWNNDVRALFQLPVVLRKAPSVTWGGNVSTWTVASQGSFVPVNSISVWRTTPVDATLNLATSTIAANHAVAIRQNGAAAAWIDFDAEF